MTNASIRPGPAFCAPAAVSTKMPVPITQPIPNRVSWNAPSERCSDFFSAVAKMASSGLTRSNSMEFPLAGGTRLHGRALIIVWWEASLAPQTARAIPFVFNGRG